MCWGKKKKNRTDRSNGTYREMDLEYRHWTSSAVWLLLSHCCKSTETTQPIGFIFHLLTQDLDYSVNKRTTAQTVMKLKSSAVGNWRQKWCTARFRTTYCWEHSSLESQSRLSKELLPNTRVLPGAGHPTGSLEGHELRPGCCYSRSIGKCWAQSPPFHANIRETICFSQA